MSARWWMWMSRRGGGRPPGPENLPSQSWKIVQRAPTPSLPPDPETSDLYRELLLTSTHLSCLPPKLFSTDKAGWAAVWKQRHLLRCPGHNRSNRQRNSNVKHISNDMFLCGGSIHAELVLFTPCVNLYFKKSRFYTQICLLVKLGAI